MNNEDYCSYELSKALKECGFDEPCRCCYIVDKDTESNIEFTEYASRSKWNSAEIGGSKYPYKHISAPHIYHVQKWLREKKRIYAYCEPNCLKKWFARAIDLTKNEDLLFDGEMFDNFEKATEYAISAALELIKKGE